MDIYLFLINFMLKNLYFIVNFLRTYIDFFITNFSYNL